MTPIEQPQPPTTRTLLTAAEVAAEFRVSQDTVRLWAHAGKIETVRLGNRTFRYPRDSVDRFMAENTHGPA